MSNLGFADFTSKSKRRFPNGSQKNKTANTIQRRAVKIEQNSEHPLFLFALTGEELAEIAEISRISRDKDGKLLGYQRPGVKETRKRYR